MRRKMQPGEEGWTIFAPGRVNLIGEHIDYHGLPVLPMALCRGVTASFRARRDRTISAASEGYGAREFEWTDRLEPVEAGDWENYLRAAARIVGERWGVGRGVDASVVSDLPAAAGLSSSTALMVAFVIGLLRGNGHSPSFEELMEVLPDGEQFVGTRGGGMDHAACLGSRAGCASLIEFDPLSVRPVRVPPDWAFLVAHSMQTAEKAGGAREEYNARRTAGNSALRTLGYATYREAIEARASAERLAGLERDAFLHVTTESQRVQDAVCTMERGDAGAFGRVLVESHASLRDRLKVSSHALDRLVDAAMASGAIGARLTGAGFGGCAVVLCARADAERVRQGLNERFYSGLGEGRILNAEPGPSVLENLYAPSTD
ncbi:MAG TPA: galactokinase family protein [Bryobacteraceae bacterium]